MKQILTLGAYLPSYYRPQTMSGFKQKLSAMLKGKRKRSQKRQSNRQNRTPIGYRVWSYRKLKKKKPLINRVRSLREKSKLYTGISV